MPCKWMTNGFFIRYNIVKWLFQGNVKKLVFSVVRRGPRVCRGRSTMKDILYNSTYSHLEVPGYRGRSIMKDRLYYKTYSHLEVPACAGEDP